MSASTRAAIDAMDLVSLDLQPTWRVYAEALGFSFDQWDIFQKDAADAVVGGTGDPAVPVVCMISNVLCYCTDQQTADFLASLFDRGVVAIIVNERGAEQRMCDMLADRGVVVAKLLDQVAAGRDDRQCVYLAPGHPRLAGIPLALDQWVVYPNQPYEEKKQRYMQQNQ